MSENGTTNDDYLAEQRRLAFQRVAQKRQEEDRLVAEKLKREEDEKLNYKKLMEEKAEKLKQLTAQRVVEYKVLCNILFCFFFFFLMLTIFIS